MNYSDIVKPNGENAMDATREQLKILMAMIKRALPDALYGLDVEGIIRHLQADESNLPDALSGALDAFQTPLVSALTVEVVSEFDLDGGRFDVVRVKWTGKTDPYIRDCIEAANTASRPVVNTFEDWRRVCQHRDKLPEELRGKELITNCPSGNDTFGVRAIYRYSEDGESGVHTLNRLRKEIHLILRRRPD